jgi:exodeoxyribonuclease-1
MILRYRARNFPDSLNNEDKSSWNEYRHERFTNQENTYPFSYQEYLSRIDELLEENQDNQENTKVLKELKQWGKLVTLGLNI